MARQKKWKNEAERLAAYRAARTDSAESVRNEYPIRTESATRTDSPRTDCGPVFVAFRDQAHVPHNCMADPWIGAGRGTPRTYQGAPYVLVARGTVDPTQPEHGVVTLADWSARLAQHCAHGFAGWSCHVC